MDTDNSVVGAEGREGRVWVEVVQVGVGGWGASVIVSTIK